MIEMGRYGKTELIREDEVTSENQMESSSEFDDSIFDTHDLTN